MFQFDQTHEDYLLSLGRENTDQRMTDAQFVVQEIHRFWRSKRCRDMMDGDLYYRGRHAILHKQRTAIGENGELITLDNLPNSRIVDNQFRKLVDQKANYLVGQPFVIRSEDQTFVDALRPYLLTKKFARRSPATRCAAASDGCSRITTRTALWRFGGCALMKLSLCGRTRNTHDLTPPSAYMT